MLFPTLDFGIYFLFVFTFNWLLCDRAILRKWFLVLASYFFYGFWDWRYTPLLFASSTISFGAGWLLETSTEPRRRRWTLALAIALQLAILGYFKYTNFFIDSLERLLTTFGFARDLPVFQVILPIGISFFTFQGISYIVDVYRGNVHASMSLLDFLLFKAFFPQLVAGPIVRAGEFLPQLQDKPDPRRILAGMGFLLILVGLFKKSIVANYLAVDMVDPVFADPKVFGTIDVLLATYGYAIQIYCDFSAYSDMAIGAAALLGFRFPRNFNQPYRAESIQDFWRRWHITLSRWLRDYLYIPLGGSRQGTTATNRNLLLTMVLGGIWHGASWNFALWGSLHGIGLFVERLFRGPRETAGTGAGWPRRAAAVFMVFHFVCFAWIFFRAVSLDMALDFLAAFGNIHLPSRFLTGFLVSLLGLGFAAHFLPPNLMTIAERQFIRLTPVEKGLFVGMVIILIEAMAMEGVAPFIYFQF